MSGDRDKVHLGGGALCNGRPLPPPVKTLFYDLRSQLPRTFRKTKHSTAGGWFQQRSWAPKRPSKRKKQDKNKTTQKKRSIFFSILKKNTENLDDQPSLSTNLLLLFNGCLLWRQKYWFGCWDGGFAQAEPRWWRFVLGFCQITLVMPDKGGPRLFFFFFSPSLISSRLI